MTQPDGLIEFQLAGISDIGQQTMNQRSEWDRIWENTKSQISGVAAAALDAATGSSLEERGAQYHQKSTQYSGQVQQQGQAVNQINSIAENTNREMVSRMSRGA